MASVPDTPFATPRIRDEKQGGIVWKFIERTKGKGVEYFTYERTREHPHPDGVYPRCTFAKQPNDTDGKLLLAEQRSQMRQEDKLIPAVITYRYEPIASPDGEPPEIWITGEVFSKNDILFFRMDKPVRDNPLGNVVLLGSTKAGMKVLLPMYMRAAEKKMKLRLYGSLMPFSGTFPGKKTALPNVQFITIQGTFMPTDPDDLPEDQKIIIQPGDSLPGFEVKVEIAGSAGANGPLVAAKAAAPGSQSRPTATLRPSHSDSFPLSCFFVDLTKSSFAQRENATSANLP